VWWVAYIRSKYAALVEDIKRYQALKQDLRTRMGRASAEAEVQIVAGARAFLSTIDSLASLHIKLTPDQRLVAIIDEAGTVPEYKLPLLINMGAAAVVAIGDQNQLQPFTFARDDPQDGFFQRAVRAIGTVPMLSIQYRMHPHISQLVSDLFYKGALLTDPSVAELRAAAPDSGLQWLDYPTANAESDDAKKRCNMREVALIADFMRGPLQGILAQGKTVAIITFYKHQLRMLMDQAVHAGLVHTEKALHELKSKKKGTPGTLTRFKNPNFNIVTVDAAQGSEADVVVISCVRCNTRKDIGFVRDPNRACVALSRAKERMLIVGSARTMSKDPLWRKVREAAEEY
jgi:senataxin